LLKAFPRNVLSNQSLHHLLLEERVQPNLAAEADKEEQAFFYTPTSSMSALQMEKASNANVLAFLRKQLLGPKDVDHLSSRNSRTCIRAFSEFAKICPDRATTIIEVLPVDGFEDLVYSSLLSLASAMGRSEFFTFCERQIARGHGSRQFIEQMAMSCLDLAKHPNGLPDEVLAYFNASLFDEDDPPSRPVAQEDAEEKNKPISVLWNHGGQRLVPRGNYPLLSSIWWGFVLRASPEPDRALQLITEHAQLRNERVDVWVHFIGFDVLRSLRSCSCHQATQFIDTVLTRFPKVSESHEAVMMVAHSWQWSAVNDYLGWAKLIRNTGWARARQAYGELVGLRHILQRDDQQLQTEAKRIVMEGDTDERIGLTFAAGNLWGKIQLKWDATPLLLQLAEIADDAVSSAVVDTFRTAPEPLMSDNATRSVLSAMVRGGTLDRATASHSLLRALSDVVPIFPDEAMQAARVIVRRAHLELGNIQTSWVTDVQELIHIAVALQRLEGHYRLGGIELFEDLVRARAHNLDGVLAELDGVSRPFAVRQPTRRLRRRGTR
jgi:hypothetical protein